MDLLLVLSICSSVFIKQAKFALSTLQSFHFAMCVFNAAGFLRNSQHFIVTLCASNCASGVGWIVAFANLHWIGTAHCCLDCLVCAKPQVLPNKTMSTHILAHSPSREGFSSLLLDWRLAMLSRGCAVTSNVYADLGMNGWCLGDSCADWCAIHLVRGEKKKCIRATTTNGAPRDVFSLFSRSHRIERLCGDYRCLTWWNEHKSLERVNLFIAKFEQSKPTSSVKKSKYLTCKRDGTLSKESR